MHTIETVEKKPHSKSGRQILPQVLAIMACAVVLSACSTVAKVVPGADSLWGNETEDQKDQEFPDLAETPQRPDTKDARKKEKELSEGLVGDLEQSNYTREEITANQERVFSSETPEGENQGANAGEADFPDFTPTTTLPAQPEAAGDETPSNVPAEGYEAGDPSKDPEASQTPLE